MFSVDVRLDADARTRCRACAARRRRFALGGIGAHGADLSCTNSYATFAAPRSVPCSPDMVAPTTSRPTRAERRGLGRCKKVSQAIRERAARRVCWKIKLNEFRVTRGVKNRDVPQVLQGDEPRSLRVRTQARQKHATARRASRETGMADVRPCACAAMTRISTALDAK